MIKQLTISNFKSHKRTALALGNLTVLTGVNGCGKTSLIQGLLLLRQTYMKHRLDEGLDLNQPLCNIGIANDALYKLASNSFMKFEIKTDDDKDFLFEYEVGDNLMDSFIKKYHYSSGAEDVEQLKALSLFNNDFQYISANRWGGKSIFPKETYAVESQKQISLNEGQGELVAHFLDKYGNDSMMDYYECDHNETDLSLLQQTVYWEQKISPNVTIDVELGKDSASYNIIYGFNGDNDTAKPIRRLRAENIGYGISYTLPVIVAILSAKPGALIVMENPEAHLHPEGQAELAKLIVKAAQLGVQIVLETHSDHIINGIQIACKRQKCSDFAITPDLVKLYYLKTNEMHASVADLITIKDNGMLDFQPKGFFDRAEKDLMTLYQ